MTHLGASRGSLAPCNCKWTHVAAPTREVASEMKAWVTPGKPPRPAEVIAEGGGNLEWIMEEVDDEYQLCPGNNSNNAPPLSFPLCLEAMEPGRNMLQNYKK